MASKYQYYDTAPPFYEQSQERTNSRYQNYYDKMPDNQKGKQQIYEQLQGRPLTKAAAYEQPIFKNLHTTQNEKHPRTYEILQGRALTQGSADEQPTSKQLHSPAPFSPSNQTQPIVVQPFPVQISTQQVTPTSNVVFYQQPGVTTLVLANQPRPKSYLLCSIFFFFITHPLAIGALIASIVSIHQAGHGNYVCAKRSGETAKVLHVVGWVLNFLIATSLVIVYNL